MRLTGSSSSRNNKLSASLGTILRSIAICLCSLYVGFRFGYQQGLARTAQALVERNLQTNTNTNVNNDNAVQSPLFPQSTRSFVTGMSLVDRNEFANQFDTGVPLFQSHDKNNQVLILHANKAMPPVASTTEPNQLSVESATQNCNYLSLILTQPDRHDQCIAIMGQYNSYHVHKFMRIDNRTKIDNSKPLQLVKRGTDIRSFTTKTPTLTQTHKYWTLVLQPYLTNLQTYLDKLRPIAEKVAIHNTIIVMVCNHGQSELLVNFVCNAQQRNLSLDQILVFATDKNTYELCQQLGLTAFYDEVLFKDIPSKHANNFGDDTYKMTILSKLYCVHLVGQLGFHYLFQDVDMVWYKNPIDYFLPKPPFDNDYDIYMQTDGNYAQFYAPYSGNTGFYFVQNNPKTQHFMNQFLVNGDLILATKTHQAPFLSLLSEHASLHGVKVKILLDDLFPGGVHFQQKKLFMKYLLKVVPVPDGFPFDPWIFHMSWTANKEQKIQFLQQMGEWYVQGNCRQGRECCASEPIVQCHFRDVPSVIPCHDSPPKTPGKPSWYPTS